MDRPVPSPNPPQSASSEPCAPQLAPPRCWSCGKPIEPADVFCRHCGRPQDRATAWYYQPIWILFMAFLVLGPLALILVWKAPRISPAAKWTLAAVILVYSVWVMWYGWSVLAPALRDFGELTKELNGLQ